MSLCPSSLNVEEVACQVMSVCPVGCYTLVKFPRCDDAGGGGPPYGDLVSRKAAPLTARVRQVLSQCNNSQHNTVDCEGANRTNITFSEHLLSSQHKKIYNRKNTRHLLNSI